ncbi:hypothetical protein [Psychrobacter namhaensis]|uniref:hypothetical protein n=1 Tax=Psychrobacter namhaensis TaxID=292734 RepID=UPI0018DF0262|nr:hypothetical protein [Psychrobacter namhaensis]
MKITKLDNFGEGFTVTPRKPHKSDAPLGTPLTHTERAMRVTDVVKSRLERYGICHAAIFTGKARRNALNQMWRLNSTGAMQLERVADKSGNIIAYKVIKQ